MRQISLLVLALMCHVLVLKANNRYEQSMKNAIPKIFVTNNTTELSMLYHEFKDLSNDKTNDWRPVYYAILTKAFLHFLEEDSVIKFNHLKQALQELDALDSFSDSFSDNDVCEVVALKGFIKMLEMQYISEDVAYEKAKQVYRLLGFALQKNPKNPRANLFMGQMEYGSAKYLKWDTKGCCTLIAHSVSLFNDFKPKKALDPSWGKQMALLSLNTKCNH